MTKIVTNSGKWVDLVNPDPATICIEDIATHLSRINRFTGASSLPYSVAQHSLVVSSCCSPGMELHGLLHDAAEAYLGDVSTPLKSTLAGYHEMESRMMGAIYEAFGLVMPVNCGEVRDADRAAFLVEWERLMPEADHGVLGLAGLWWDEMLDTARAETDWTLAYCGGDEAASRFIDRFVRLIDRRITSIHPKRGELASRES